MKNSSTNTTCSILLTFGFLILTSLLLTITAQPAGYEFHESDGLLKVPNYVNAPNGQTKSYFNYSHEVGDIATIFDYREMEWVAVKIIERTRNGVYNSYKTSPAFTAMMGEPRQTNGPGEWISEIFVRKIKRKR